jgi:hypothetical protein
MLNISKYRKVIVGCSAIVTASLAGFVQSASAAEQLNNQNVRIDRGTVLIAGNSSNASGVSVGTINNPSVGSSTPSGPAPGLSGRAGTISSRVSLARSNYAQAAANLAQASTVQPVAVNTSPIRYGREVADLASCGCPNADTVSTDPTPRPELVAAKAAEADAAAELAAAKAEARQFIESVKSSGNNSSAGSSPVW